MVPGVPGLEATLKPILFSGETQRGELRASTDTTSLPLVFYLDWKVRISRPHVVKMLLVAMNLQLLFYQRSLLYNLRVPLATSWNSTT